MTHWSRNYVGLPHLRAGRSLQGVDCYGLLWLVYRDVLCVELAKYEQETLDAVERQEIAELIAVGRASSPWSSVATGAEREFDMAVFRRGGIESHIGIVVSHGHMLHVVEAGESHVESFASGRWKAKLVGLHRHEACM